jgi:hypothetical protein
MPNPQFLGVTPGHAVMAGNEQKAPSLWIKGATFQQIAAAGFGIATASGAWRAVHRALAQIPSRRPIRRAKMVDVTPEPAPLPLDHRRQ